jgi:hypothetical protein
MSPETTASRQGETGRIYYTRQYGWRNSGQPRFFDSPEALIKTFSGTLARKATKLKTPRLGKAAAKTRAKKPAPKKRRVSKAA